jgi:hypothetical protein
MPLFSSLSIRDSNNNHAKNKLEKSPHTRRASLPGRKASIARKGGVVDEDVSTRAVAGSSSRLMSDANDGNPITPKSLVGDQPDHTRDHSVDQPDIRDKAPTPPPHDQVYADADRTEDAGNRDSTLTTSTWRGNPAARNKDAFAGNTYGAEAHDHSESYMPTGDRPVDVSIARKKIQIAVEAELAADRAIEAARQAVVEARTVVAAIEKQVNEEFERAHARRLETAGVLKELEKLGRHNN